MAEKEEIAFWAQYRDEDSLISAVQAFRDRAIPFFGAYAVFGENEADLLRTLNAHEILTASDDELLKKMNRVPDMMAPKLEKIDPPKLREEIRRISRGTQEAVEAMRGQARQQLERVLGKKEGADA